MKSQISLVKSLWLLSKGIVGCHLQVYKGRLVAKYIFLLKWFN